MHGKSRKGITEGQEILSRWTKYCSELQILQNYGDNDVLDCNQPPEDDLQPILRAEAEVAVTALPKGGSLPELINMQNVFKQAGRP